MITGDGLELDEFRLVRLLGKGGMGQVWIGHDTLLDRAVAIKLIGARNPDATARDRFLTEARAVARLQHPNVVTIFRVGTTADGRPYLAQELIRGVSLDHVARPMPAARVRELGLGIARGLAAAHRRGILHRDVKPANVMLAEPGTVKLLDFGLAKLGHDQLPEHDEGPSTRRFAARSGWTGGIAAEASDLATGSGSFAAGDTLDLGPAGAAQPTLDLPVPVVPERAAVRRVEGPGTPAPTPHIITADGVVLGTPRYLAPELWRGEPATVRTDLYALGILLHELAAGDAPYPATDLAELRASALAGGAPAVVTRAPELGARLAALIDRLVALSPAERPGSADEVVHELEAMLGAAGPVPGGNPYRGLRAFEAEHRALFFGRGRDVSTLCELLRVEALVCVAGDSGIGKSSVCRAGVAPAIVAGALDDGRCWRTVALVPGRAPAQALAAALGLPPITAALPAAERLRACGEPAGTGVLIVVDQLEELITVAAPHEAAAAAELLVAVAAGAPGIKILCTVRGDFLTRVAALPELGPTLARGLHLLRMLTLDDLRETVIGPARATGVRFESEAMVGALVDGAVASGGLPLLQFALAELWDARDHGRAVITQAALDELGGVGGALARHADRVLAPLASEARAAARRLLTRLVSAERTRAVRGHDELVPDGETAAAAALEALIRGRLVVARETADGGATYELAHEALIHGWHALRGWLDDAAGRRAVLERLTAAATDWDRRGRRPDLLWRAAQLAEHGPSVGPAAAAAELDARDRAFVAASRRAMRRRRALAIALAVIVPAGIALAIAIPRLEARRARDREIRRAIIAAERHLAAATAADQRGLALAIQAFAGFDAPAGDDAAAEATWDDAVRADRDARRAYRDAAAALEAAVLRDGGRADVRHHMAEVLLAHALVAERRHDHDGAVELVSRLGQYDPGGASRARWDAPARLALSAPRALGIELHRDTAATAVAVPPVATIAGDHLDVARLDPGTYVAVITMPDGLVVRDPLRLTRGEQLARTVAPPPRAAIPADFVYVPAGRFLFGSDHDDVFRRDFVYAPPLHPAETAAFLIARHETTMAEWMDYLRSLAPDECERRRPRTLGAAGLLLKIDDVDGGGFLVSMQIGRHAYEAAADGHLTFPNRSRRATVAVARLPVSGIDWDDVLAYTAWLSATGRVPGARPCHEREWERAARGADGRNFPGGVALLGPDDANHDATYDHKPGAMGPDEVGVHPASDSPFGVADLAGNVWEWIVTADGTPVTRGGSWYHGATTALIPNRDVTEPGLRNLDTGLRVCADAPAAR